MDARWEEIITIPARRDESEDEVKAKAVQAAVEKWRVNPNTVRVEGPLQWHGPADRVSIEQSSGDAYSVNVSISR